MANIRILDEDTSRIAQIVTDVNALRATLGLSALTTDEVIVGCVGVGLNALTDRLDVPNSRANIPTLSIAGLAYTEDTIVFPGDVQARVDAIAALLSVTALALSSLALHAGCLMMLAETDNKGYVPGFS
jgi:hypothetical protein